MPNSIKYSASAQSLALKKGNFWIGTGDVGKGPSSTTGYYTGVNPQSGGYTIYLQKTGAPGELSYGTAANDSELISYTNNLAGTSYTTAAQCLAYFSGQSDKICVNRDYEGIITNGLVYLLDAGFTPSYPTSGTTWYDLISNSASTLTNGPTFRSDNGGSIVFDGTNDYASTGMTVEAPTNSNLQSIGVWLYGNNSSNSFTGTNASQQGACHMIVNWSASNQIRFAQTWYGGSPTESTDFATVTSSASGWNYMVVIKKSVQTYDVYFNASKVISDVIKEANLSTSFEFGKWWSSMYVPMNGIAVVQSYNRALSAAEVLQNYNAQKARFGL